MADLENACTTIAWDGKRFVWQDPDFRDCQLGMDPPPDNGLFERIVGQMGEAAREAGKVEVPIERVVPPPEDWWAATADAGLRVPLGPSGARKVQHLELGAGTAQHALVVGKTGSGKSTLLHVLVTGLALSYSPDEVEVYLVDFKKGVEFKVYATHKLPHARVIAIESEREFGLSVLQGLDDELKRRGDLMRRAGVDGLADYRRRSGEALPRILLLVDEFQEFFTEDDRIAAQAAQILDRLVRQGRAFGMHVLLGSQTLAGTYSLARSTIDQMAVRIALQCSDADSRLILADDNAAARLLSRPGEAIYNAANGLVEGNNRFQVAWLPDEQHAHYLRQVHGLADRSKYRPVQPPIVFEGNTPAEVEKNAALRELLATPAPPADARRLLAWLGDPIAIRDAVAAPFRRQSGSNLLIVGQDEPAALGMLAVALVGLAAQLPPAVAGDVPAAFNVLDFGATDAPHAEFFVQIKGQLPHNLAVGRRRQLPDMIGALAAEVQRRLDADVPGAPSLFLCVYGLHRARDLRPDDSLGIPSFSDEPSAGPNLPEQFAAILRDGPEVGVHTLVWCDTVTNLNRSLDRRAQREFAMRIAMQMSAEDSSNLLDAPDAAKLGPHRALFYSEDEGRLEKFRPYGVPGADWLAWAGEQLQGRAT